MRTCASIPRRPAISISERPPHTPANTASGAVFARLRVEEERGRLRLAWSLLGSIWVHLALAMIALARCGSLDAAEPAPEQRLTLLATAPLPDRRDAQGGPSGLGANAFDGDLADLDPATLSALDPRTLEGIDPALLSELDPALLEALLAMDLPQDLRLAALAALQAPPPDARIAPDLQAPAQGATSAAQDAAVAPTTASTTQQDGAGAPVTSRREPATARDPLDAVADAALPPEPQPDAEQADPDPDQPDEEPEPEPEPEPAPDTKDPVWQQYVHVDKDAPVKAPLDAFGLISSRDARSEEAHRAEVVAPNEGPRTQPLEGVPIASGTPALLLEDGNPETETAGDLPSASAPAPRPTPQALGGGQKGEAPGRGAPDLGGTTRGGELARSGRQAAATSPVVILAGGGPGQEGVTPAPTGTREQATRSDAWWAPSVARILVPTPVSPPATAAITADDTTQATDRAELQRPDRRDRRGGTEQPDDVDEQAPEADADTQEPQAGEAEPVETPPEPVESVSDLRDDLGWGGVDRKRLQPKRTLPGVASDEGNQPTSQQVANEVLELDRFATVDATGTPLGRYRATLDDEVRQAWLDMDLSLHERAMGIQGDVVVVFHIQANGRVIDRALVRSSGYPSLDRMAMDAIPERLPRFPKDVEVADLFHRYTFRYRNPMIVGGSAP